MSSHDLLRPTLVSSRDVLFFVLVLKIYTYYVFSCIRIIKEHYWSLASPWPGDVWRRFSGQPRIFLIKIIHILFYDTWVLYILFYTLTMILYIFFLTSFFSKLVSFTFHLVHSLSTWFTHSLISPLFRLGTAPAHPRCGGNS